MGVATSDAPVVERNGNERGRQRGQDKKREKKMAHARVQMRNNQQRLCPSVTVPGKICKFGDKCTAEHSIEKFLETKPEDIGELIFQSSFCESFCDKFTYQFFRP